MKQMRMDAKIGAAGARWLAVAALSLGTLVGCHKDQTPPEEPVATPQVTSEQLQQSARQLANDAATLGNQAGEKLQQMTADQLKTFKAKKDMFEQNMQLQMKQMGPAIDQLKQNVMNASQETQQKLGQSMDSLTRKQQNFDQAMEKAKNATAAGWDDAQKKAAEAYKELTEEFQQVARQYQSNQ